MASAELLPKNHNLTARMENKYFPDFSQLRQTAIDAFLRNLTPRGVLATSEGRFRAIFIRDAAKGICQALEKDQAGSLDVVLEGARRTLVTGAQHQGTRFRWITRERRGVIIHESHGPDSDQEHLGQIVKAKNGKWVHEVDGHYEGETYRGLDPTLWWICLFADYVRRSRDFALMDQLWPNFEAAVSWVDRYGRNLIKGGFEGKRPPRNLGWKDSEDAFIDEKGNYPVYPVAPLDVNSVAVLADQKAADLYELKGHQRQARILRLRADERKELIDKLFWLNEYSVYAPAVDALNEPVRVRTSDSVYALAAGVADGRSVSIARSMLANDLFVEGRGLHTRSTFSKQFSAQSYQNGTVWYHLAPMAAAACEKLGLLEEANKFDSCVVTIVREGFPELDSVDRYGRVLPFTERHPETGQERVVGCKNFTMTIGAVLNRLAS